MPKPNYERLSIRTIELPAQLLSVNGIQIFLMCAGIGSRWRYAYPKQLAMIDGVPNITRTFQMLATMGIDETDIYVIVNQQTFDMFPPTRNLLVVPVSNREIDRFRNSFKAIDYTKRIIYLYGDVVYDRNDLITILSLQYNCFVGSVGNNGLTTKKWGEICAVIAQNIDMFIEDVNDTASKFEAGMIDREIGWEVYSSHKANYQFILTNGKTNDYDTIEEYQIIKKSYEQ